MAATDTPAELEKQGEASKEDENSKKRKRLGKNANKNISLRSKITDSCDAILYPNLNPCLTEKLDEVLNQGKFFVSNSLKQTLFYPIQ